MGSTVGIQHKSHPCHICFMALRTTTTIFVVGIPQWLCFTMISLQTLNVPMNSQLPPPIVNLVLAAIVICVSSPKAATTNATTRRRNTARSRRKVATNARITYVVRARKKVTSFPHLRLIPMLVSSKGQMVRQHCKPLVVPPHPLDSSEPSLVSSALFFLHEIAYF